MMTKTYSTGSFDRFGPTNGYILDLILTEESTDVAANTSTVSYKLQLRSGSGNRFDWELTSKLSLNGAEVAAKTEEKYLDFNSTWVLLSGKTTVKHDDNGALAMAYTATVTPWNGGNDYTPPALTLTGTMALTDIPRASAVAATAAYIGDAATVAVSRKSADFTHSIRYQFGSLSGYIADATGTHSDQEKKLTATTIVFPIPENFYGEIPNDPSDFCTLTCTTYSGDTQIGEPRTARFTVTADPARCGPTVYAETEEANEAVLALTGNSRVLVAGRSAVLLAIMPEVRHHASLTAIYVNGVKTQETSYRIDPVMTADITVRAVDSRGYFAEYTVPGLSLVPYVPLSFFAEASRTDPTSGNAAVQLTGKWYEGTFGAAENTLTAQYRIDGGEPVPFIPDTDGGNIAAQLSLTGLDYRTSHSIEVTLSDRLDTVTKTAQVSRGIPVFDWGEDDFCFHVPVIFTATDGTKFTLTFTEGQLKGERI